jgi:hypothetical protein
LYIFSIVEIAASFDTSTRRKEVTKQLRVVRIPNLLSGGSFLLLSCLYLVSHVCLFFLGYSPSTGIKQLDTASVRWHSPNKSDAI